MSKAVPPPRLFISCGEPSGDIHAAALLLSMRKQRPDLACAALAGPSLRAAGVNEVHGIEELSVMGFTEVFSALPRALRVPVAHIVVRSWCRSLLSAFGREKPETGRESDRPAFPEDFRATG